MNSLSSQQQSGSFTPKAEKKRKGGAGISNDELIEKTTTSSANTGQSSTLRGGNEAYGFSDKEIRRAFIAKVYTIVCIQLLTTTVFIGAFLFIDDARHWALRQTDVFLLSFLGYIIVTLLLVCCPGIRRHHPTNLIILAVFTLCLSYMVAVISITYKTESALLAFGICAVCSLTVTIFSWTTNLDFTRFGAYIFVSGICLMLFGAVVMFFHAPLLHKVYAGVGALLFMLYLIFDTQLIMGGKSHAISPDEYVLAALTLYGDIIQIFLFILQLIGEKRGD